MRAGAHALSLLAVPMNVHILQALEEGPRPLVDVRLAAGSPPQTTMRGHLRALAEAGIVERRRQADFPGPVDMTLAAPGYELLSVAKVLETWLHQAPESPLNLGSAAAKSAVKALVEGWSSGIVRALAAKPLALTELSRLITGLSYPSLERRLGAMRLAGQIEPSPSAGRGTPYRATDWLRAAIAPLLAAARWEQSTLPDATAPLRRLDIESAFLLVLSRVTLPPSQAGDCRFAVELRSSEGITRVVGVTARVKNGRVISCVARLEGQVTAWISGSVVDWLRAVLDGDKRSLEAGGDCDLAFGVLEGLRDSLFRAPLHA